MPADRCGLKPTATASKEALVERIRRSFESCRAVVAGLTESTLADSVPFFGGRKATKARGAIALAQLASALARHGPFGRAALALAMLAAGPVERLVAQCPDGSAPPCRVTRPAPTPSSNSVAVLYFENRSRDSADAYLAEGLTEAIITQLGDLPRLTVKSRFLVRRYQGAAASTDPAAIGRALGARRTSPGASRPGSPATPRSPPRGPGSGWRMPSGYTGVGATVRRRPTVSSRTAGPRRIARWRSVLRARMAGWRAATC
jgi:hypothetical protein